MKILITGAAGFIGFHLASKLAKRGEEIIGIDNINDYYDVNLKFARLKNLGISRDEIEENKFMASKIYPNLSGANLTPNLASNLKPKGQI